MFSVAEKKIFEARAKKFFYNLPNDYWAEQKTFEAKIALVKEVTKVADAHQLEYAKISENENYGNLWDKAYLKLSGDIPANWQGKNVAFQLKLGGEALLFDKNDHPWYGFTTTSVFVAEYTKEIFQYTKSAKAEHLDLTLELFANGNLGAETNISNPTTSCEVGVIRKIRYGVFRPEVWHLRLEFEVVMSLLGIMRNDTNCVSNDKEFNSNSYRETRILKTLMKAIDVYLDNPDNAAQSRAILQEILSQAAAPNTMTVAAVGHCHIDVAWLWRIEETIGKVGRSFANQVYLIKNNPDYVFGASQPFLYQLVKEYYPALYEEVKALVKAGRWELQGGMYVEADCNLTNGESLVRQFLHGKNFFMDEFGVEVKNLWLPDVFGYSGAMPQIIKKSNCDFFLTQKLCWNQYNKLPFHAFHWQGIDGSRVLTFFPPEDNYNAMLTPDQLNYGANNFSENYMLNEFLSLFGIGDGGGGPKEEYLERAKLCKNLNGSPKVEFSRADSFFDRLSNHSSELPEWIGELYFEYHRGTYTSQGKVKQANRECEELLVASEFIFTLLTANEYPKKELDSCWKELLVQQFHDVLPGSSIAGVYEDAAKAHEKIKETIKKLLQGCAEKLWQKSPQHLTFVNTLPYDFTQLVELPNGKALVNLPACSIVSIEKKSLEEIKTVENDLILENELIAYTFSPDGTLKKAFDYQAKREVISGVGNTLKLFVDTPNDYEAWDIDLTYENQFIEQARVTNISDKTIAKDYQSITFELEIGNSKIVQTITLANNSKLLEFHNWVDYKESRRMLRVSFDSSIMANEATFDIQYGYVKRPTHRNTSWDKARFEVVAQKYMDISEADYGVALINDSKYGCKVFHNQLDLNLLRSPSWPDANADRCTHEFSYAFLPHTGNLINSQVMSEAAQFNRAPLIFDNYKTTLENEKFPIFLEGPNASMEVLKRAEKSDDIIVRIVEKAHLNTLATLNLDAKSRVYVTNLIEWSQEEELINLDGKVELKLSPFEIKTLKIKR